MAERLQVGPVTRCEGLLPYGNIIEHGTLVVSVFLIGVWGGGAAGAHVTSVSVSQGSVKGMVP